MEVSTEKSKVMTNGTNNISAGISMNGQKLEEVTNLKYLGATLWRVVTCTAEICIRAASAMAAMTRPNRIWRCNTISFISRFKLFECLVTATLLYCCDTWTLLDDPKKKKKKKRRIHAFEIKLPDETPPHLLLGA